MLLLCDRHQIAPLKESTMKTKMSYLRKAVKLFLAATLALQAHPALSSDISWDTGDVFVAIGNGAYNIYSNSGVLKESIEDGLGGFTTTPAFTADLSRLFTINFSNSALVVYDGNVPHAIQKTISTVEYNPYGMPESIVFAANGHYFVGTSEGTGNILEFDDTDTYVGSHAVARDVNGSDNVDLAVNQTTLFYTSQGSSVKRYDLIAGQLPDFATNLPDPYAFAFRILPPGDGSGGLLVANNTAIVRLDAAGAVIKSYTVDGESGWYSVNLDPNGTSFWAGAVYSTNFYRFNIDTGVVELGPITAGGDLRGVTIKGEPTAALARHHFVTGCGIIKQECKATAWSFSGNVGHLIGGTVSGQFEIVDHKNGITYHSTAISALKFSGPVLTAPDKVIFTATFKANKCGIADKIVTVTIQDSGTSQIKTDTIMLSGDITVPEASLSGGNFLIHKAEDQVDPTLWNHCSCSHPKDTDDHTSDDGDEKDRRPKDGKKPCPDGDSHRSDDGDKHDRNHQGEQKPCASSGSTKR